MAEKMVSVTSSGLFRVTTDALDNGDIVQTIEARDMLVNQWEILSIDLMRTRDEQTRAALIALKWTPPK